VWAAIAADLAGRRRGALALGAAALLAKEGAVVWPVLGLLASLLAGRTVMESLRRAAVPAAIVVAYVAVRHAVLDVPGQEGGLGHGTAGAKQITAMLGHQAWYTLFPVSTVYDWQMPWDDPPAAATIAGVFALLAIAWKETRAPALWFSAALVPTLFVQAVVPLNIMVADRFLEFALPAAALVAARCVTAQRGAAAAAALLVLSPAARSPRRRSRRGGATAPSGPRSLSGRRATGARTSGSVPRRCARAMRWRR
jgi:hypothetical protein